MKTIITVTDITQMGEGKVCVAGYLPDGTCIRPVINGGFKRDWLENGDQVVIRPFSRVEFDLSHNIPNQRPHTEDWFISKPFFKNYGLLNPDKQRELLSRTDCDCIATIFGATICEDDDNIYGKYINRGEGKRSLGTISISKLLNVIYRKIDDKWDYRIKFVDNSGEIYRLKVTDLSFRSFLDYNHIQEGMSPERAANLLAEKLKKSKLFLRIGLARGWSKYPNRCYLQITGV